MRKFFRALSETTNNANSLQESVNYFLQFMKNASFIMSQENLLIWCTYNIPLN